MAGPARSPLPPKAAPALAAIVALLLVGAALGLITFQAPNAPNGATLTHVAAALLGSAAAAGLLAIALARRNHAAAGALLTRDPLTGLPAHAGFRDRLESTLALARRHRWRSGVLVIDLRNFREINEAHGRAGGDEALRVVARRLRAAVRREDVVARLAADRFAVIQTALSDPAGALHFAERLTAALAEPMPLHGAPPNGPLRIEADIGIALAPDDGDEACLLLARAEDALAAARGAPTPTIHCFSPAQEAALREARQLERDLREAIADGAFLLHWQPQRRLADGALIGFEALLRWPHPTRGLIPPDRFIPIAEATGLIVPLGAWVLRTAALEASTWPGGLKAAVNLSAVQLREPGLLATVTEALAEAGLPPHRLELEVTESMLLQDDHHAVRLLTGLQSLGVSIALDDFGTGWSSLAYLRRFPFNQIKMDRGFLRDLGADPRVAAVVTAILSLGHGLGMGVLAEGIETGEQAQRLLALGCEHGQGWHLGRPMPAEQARALIAEELRTRAAA